MRVTNNMLILNMMENINRNLVNMSKYQDQLATGKSITSPMDDPVGISKVLKYKTDLSELDQFERNTRDALAWLENTETSMMDVTKAYQRMRELTVQAANGTNSEQETQKIKDEVLQLKEHIITLSNSTFAGRYVFSGSQTDEKLMNEDGTYNIDVTSKELSNDFYTEYQLGVGENIQVTTSGIDIFGYVAQSNFVNEFLPDNSDVGTPATTASIIADFDLETDHSGQNYDVTYTVGTPASSVTYDVDENQLKGSSLYPLDKEDIIKVFENADDGSGNKLGDIADVYFSTSGKLTIATKEFGSNYTLDEVGNDVFTGPTSGNDSINASVAGNVTTDTDVSDAKGAQNVKISYNGETRVVGIEMSAASTVADLVTITQNAVDSAFSDMNGYSAGDIQITAPSDVITFSSNVDPDSTEKQILEVRPIEAVESQVMKDIDEFAQALDIGDFDGIDEFLGKIDEHIGTLLTEQSNIGARVNRMELVLNRIAENNVNFTRLLSDTEDADMSEIIMYLKNSENVYRASLQTGARVIQPSLIDFLG